ncbi:hypothetical protein GGX14DRAFT_476559 [Mycena pura]|uniref:Aminoglycoside phosphotransferase domain-containing protein n=1 Tax=Mycena pura TaxID=153505 RepID=A0AAD6Y325_9AGAR|nr:hypothetical protein GGX14DRAFT_476559 [Mycena pura]
MDEPFMGTLFNSNDEEIETDLEPLVYDVWSSDAPRDAQWTSMVKRVDSILKERVVKARLRKPFDPTDAVMDVEFDGGKSDFVGWSADKLEYPPEFWKCARLSAELSILHWLEAHAPDLPVPRVLASDNVSCLHVTTVMPGLDAMHSYPRLSAPAKENSVISWARVSVSMFRLPVPQQFGMIENPFVKGHPHIYVSPEHTFDISNTPDLVSFFETAITMRRSRSLAVNDAESHSILCRRLDHLLEGLQPLIALAQSDPSTSRFTLTHRDLRPNNVMLNESSGEVVGIVDWEFNECLPACMSAVYPDWIRPPIIESALYENPTNKFVTFFLEPQPERDRLCDLYEKTVKELDEDYHTCLIHGTRLRDALAWIEVYHNRDRDNDGECMDRWVEDHLFTDGAAGGHRCA